MSRLASKIAVVVPTRDRPEQVGSLLASIRSQHCWPDEIVIVNGGDTRLGTTLAGFQDLPLRYMEVQPPGLTRQKNAGVRATHPSMDLIACIDDDIVLQDGAMEAMLRFWETAGKDIGGASFNILGRPPTKSWAQRLFLMDNRKFGTVSSSGYNSPITNAEEDRTSQWLVGGATVWRREIFREHSFNEWFLGSGLGEDLYFSYSVGKQYKLYVISGARVQHREPKGSRRNSYRSGKVQVINKFYFVRSNPELSPLKCAWTLLGVLMGNLARGIGGPDLHRILRACGNAAGFLQVIGGRLPQVEASLPTTTPSAR